MELVRSHWDGENVLHYTLDLKFREDDYCLRRGSALAVQGILRRTVLNMVPPLQQNFRPDLSIGLLRNIDWAQPGPAGLGSWPDRDFPDCPS